VFDNFVQQNVVHKENFTNKSFYLDSQSYFKKSLGQTMFSRIFSHHFLRSIFYFHDKITRLTMQKIRELK